MGARDRARSAAKGFAALEVAVREPKMAGFVNIVALMIARQNAYSLGLSQRNGSRARFVLRRISRLRNNRSGRSLLSCIFCISGGRPASGYPWQPAHKCDGHQTT